MGTSLTGTKPKDTYDSLIKVGDNGPISGTAKTLSDGLGNDLPIAVSTSSVGIGTSAPTGGAKVHIASANGTTYAANPQLRISGNGVNNNVAQIVFSDDALSDAKISYFPSAAAAGQLLSLSARSTQADFQITGDGYVRLGSGMGGIQFGGDSAAANALDDYEEGTFTPTIVGSSSAGTATYSAANGRYTKIGRSVQFEIYISYSSGTGTGNLQIGGLPYTSANSATYTAVSIGLFTNITLAAAGNVPFGYVENNATLLGFVEMPSGGGNNTVIPYDAAGGIQIAGTYSV